MKDENLGYLLAGLVIGCIFVVVMTMVLSPTKALSQETLNEVCSKITNNSIAEGKVTNQNWRAKGDLSCVIPSYDHTQRIIIEKNNE